MILFTWYMDITEVWRFNDWFILWKYLSNQSALDLGDTSLTLHRFDDYCNNRQNIENNCFYFWLWKKHQKSFVLIIGFEKNIENRSFWLLAFKKTSKIVKKTSKIDCFDFYKFYTFFDQFVLNFDPLSGHNSVIFK